MSSCHLFQYERHIDLEFPDGFILWCTLFWQLKSVLNSPFRYLASLPSIHILHDTVSQYDNPVIFINVDSSFIFCIFFLFFFFFFFVVVAVALFFFASLTCCTCSRDFLSVFGVAFLLGLMSRFKLLLALFASPSVWWSCSVICDETMVLICLHTYLFSVWVLKASFNYFVKKDLFLIENSYPLWQAALSEKQFQNLNLKLFFGIVYQY